MACEALASTIQGAARERHRTPRHWYASMPYNPPLSDSFVNSVILTTLYFPGEYNKLYKDGVYLCAGCEAPLYKSETKFDSGCGWPAFYQAVEGALTLTTDKTHGMTRTEICCATCGGHVGHVFYNEGYKNPTNERHCANSISLKFQPAESTKSNKPSPL